MTLTFRDYQIEAADAVRKEWAGGVNRTAVVLPTGSGKTHVIAKLAGEHAAEGGRVLVIAHREELLDQATQRLRAHGGRVGRIQGNRTERQYRLTVASLATLHARVKTDRHRRLPYPPTMIVYDEAHHAASSSAMTVLKWAGAFDGVPTVGFTATMVRGDRRGLGDVWSSIAYARGIEWAVEQGHLVRPRGKVVVAEHMDLNTAKVSRGDYQDGELGELIAQDADQIVKAWQEHASDRITIAFTPTVASAQELTEQFRAAGVRAAIVTGSTPSRERRRIYAEAAAGQVRVLCSVGVLTEGFDLPAASCVLQCRPTKLPGLFQQMVGRGLRLHPGKSDCLILDIVGASRTQRLVTLTDICPSSEYDTAAIDALPCEVCGLSTRQTEVGEPTCSCAAEPGERDPDGGRRRLLGPAQYEDLDLIMQQSGCVWLQTVGGTPMLPAGKRTAIVWHDPDTDLYRPGHCANRGRLDGVWLAEQYMSLSEATSAVEAWATTHDPSVALRDASWRKRGGAPSPAQLDQARRFRIPGADQMSKTRLSDEISVAITSERLLA